MSTSENQKLKLLYLLDILRERTDEEHSITMDEILSALDEYGVHAERKAIYTDLAALTHYGADIIGEKSGRNYYYRLVSRSFETPELRLLVDAVQSSKFITRHKSKELIKKLEGLTSHYEARKLDRQVYVAGRIKTMNESIYYNVDVIQRGLSEGVKIKFKYFRFAPDKSEQLGHGGADYIISPWGLIWDDSNYYMIGYDEDAAEIRHYRVDKMKKIRLTELSREGREEFEKRDMATYSEKRFGMFDADIRRITLLCENSYAGVIIDRFGKAVPMLRVDDEHFETTIDVAVSDVFLGWVAGLGAGVKITSPDDVIEKMRLLIASISKNYS